MKSFFGSLFIDRQELKNNGIEYPIKVEYYKTINGIKEQIEKYGIHIIKTSYKKDTIKIEESKIENITEDENKIEDILNLLKTHQVTPICCREVLKDLYY